MSFNHLDIERISEGGWLADMAVLIRKLRWALVTIADVLLGQEDPEPEEYVEYNHDHPPSL